MDAIPPAAPRKTLVALKALSAVVLALPAITVHGVFLGIFSAAWSVLAALALVVLVVRLMRFGHRSSRIVQPALIVVLGAAIFLYSHVQLVLARTGLNQQALAIQGQCNAQNACPGHLPGWTARQDYFASETRMGGYARWPVRYWTDGADFKLELYKGPDFVERATGGARQPLVLL